MTRISSRAGFVLTMIGLAALPAHADSLTTEDIVQQLLPQARTRSYDPQRGLTVEGSEQRDSRPTINLYVNFDYDSAELKQDGMIVLDQLAAALQDNRLTQFDFLIGGHTDAAGSDRYNQDLSERRAAAVRDYLQTHHSVTANRLVVTGFGETRLLDPAVPLDGVNRRVQVTNISLPEQ